MAKVQHTPGPWKLCKETTRGEFGTDFRIRTHDGSHLAVVGPCNTEANAKLIAAAPDLLDALTKLLTYANNYSDAMRGSGHGAEQLGELADSISVAGIARAAIAKATI